MKERVLHWHSVFRGWRKRHVLSSVIFLWLFVYYSNKHCHSGKWGLAMNYIVFHRKVGWPLLLLWWIHDWYDGRCTHWHHELLPIVHQHILNLVITRMIQHVVTHIDKNHSMTAFMMLRVWLSTWHYTWLYLLLFQDYPSLLNHAPKQLQWGLLPICHRTKHICNM